MNTVELDFQLIKNAVASQFAKLCDHKLYVTNVTRDELWATYLAAFPEGSNPIYRTRTEHDCACCRSFVKTMGNVVAITDNGLESIWDVDIEGPYGEVCKRMAVFVKRHIDNEFFCSESKIGTDKNFEQLVNGVQTWNHFCVHVPKAYVDKDPGSKLSESRSTFDVFKRGLEIITIEALDTVLELIGQNSLYRGEENRFAVAKFREVLYTYKMIATDVTVWNLIPKIPPAVARIKNTAIGTLLVDLSTGMDLETAVSGFERVVAPTNYKRPKSLVTPKQVEQAKAKIQELGLTSALERRFANVNDIRANNLLYVDRTKTTKDVFDSLVTKPKLLGKIDSISITKFLTDVVPTAKVIEVMFEPKHTGNLVSLIAPVDPTAPPLFKWDNGFSWSYTGDVTDSIKERVKKAGGNVTGDLCCRLAWHNHDDLDLHMYGPNHHIYFGEKHDGNGHLDVDMNVSNPINEPVENIVYRSHKTMAVGHYQLRVHNFTKRTLLNNSYEVELDFMGTVYSFQGNNPGPKGMVTIATFDFDGKEIKNLVGMDSKRISKEVWGIKTHEFHRLNALMFSPNHWDGNVGNKHYFWMLDSCKNDGTARGFYNEFLRPELDTHRKTLELVGAKLRTEQADAQLSGLGFSSTQPNELVVRVTGAFTRTLSVIF